MEEKKQTGNLDPDGPAASSGEGIDTSKSQEKTTIGGNYNSGVTSSDEGTKRDIEKQGTMLNDQPMNDDESNGDGSNEVKDDEAH